MPKQDFCSMVGVDHPIVLAPMAGAVSPELAASVANSGALALLPIWHMSEDQLRSEIRKTQALTDKPLGVNLNMDFPSEPHLDACLNEGIRIISLFWQPPGDFVRRAQEGGAKVIFTAGSTEQARMAVDLGVDAICAQGWEAGGHVRGTVSTMALVPAVCDAIGDVPVIAAGGIADGRGLAAALSLGASAAWIGTRFLAANEAITHPEYFKQLAAASEDDTEYLENLFDIHWANAPHRALRNSTIKMWEDAGRPPPGQRPGEGDILGERDGSPVMRYQSVTPRDSITGEIEALSMWAGQSVGQVRKRQPAAEIIEEILSEAKTILSGLRVK